MLIGIPITLICTPFYIRNPEGNLLFLRREDFSGFFLEPFPGATAAAATITTATTIVITIATATFIIIIITTTAISGTPIKVKALPFKEIFQKVSISISL